MQFPMAPRRPFVRERVTGNVDDPYAWLIDKSDPATLQYLNDENRHWTAWAETRTELIDTIFNEIRTRTKEDDSVPPVRHGSYWYSSRTETGKSYAIHTRGTSRDLASDTVILDENAEADGHDYFSIGTFDLSPDQRLLAWSSDTDGSEKFTIRVRDLTSLTETDDLITNTSLGSIAWSSDSTQFFYVVPDAAMRPWQVWRHTLGTSQSSDTKVFEEPDERMFVSVELSRSGQFVFIDVQSRTTTEVLVIPADSPSNTPVVLSPRREGHEYSADHWGDRFAIVSNDDARDFRVFTCPIDDTSRWLPFIEHREGERIAQFDCFSGFAILQKWVDAQQRIFIVSRDGAQRPLAIRDEPHEAELDSNPEYTTSAIRVTYQSLTMSATIADIDIESGEHTVLKQVEVPTVSFDDYVSRRHWISSDDGVRIPVDLVHHKNTALDGTAPAVLYGYGSYEISAPPWFSVARLSLLDRGWVWALVHPRGGGELGRGWYDDGKLLNKRNTFVDTISCARGLAREGITSSHIVLRGGSAGGLLVGACMNMAPEAFAGFIAEVPFVDVVSTMSDPSLPLTVTEWEEWGDPRSEPFASYMLSYSPYDNVRNDAYSPLYVTAGLNDPRVSYHEPAKWVAKIRHESPDTSVLFKCEMGAGHGGPTGRYERWREEAQVLAFAISTRD